MWNQPKEEDLFKKFSKYTKIAGILFIVLGLLGVLFPMYMTLATVAFVSWLMLFAGISAGYFTWMTDRSDWMGWLKSFILIGVALLMLLYPMSGVATIGLLLSIYFFMDAFAGFGIASSMYPNRGWWMWVINAILSMIIGIIFVAGWPFTSMYLVGLLVGFSLFFDGIALLMGLSFWKKMDTIE
jgi:uncharacterized membrane protein HdeD (DUF308 family)